MQLTGFIAALAEQGPTRGPQNVFINRRIVKDQTIAHAIIDCLQRWRRSRSAARRCTCSSRCRPTRSTSTCTRPRRKCASASSRWCTRSCAAALMDALGSSGAPQLQLRPEHVAQTPFTAPFPGVLARRRVSESLDAVRITRSEGTAELGTDRRVAVGAAAGSDRRVLRGLGGRSASPSTSGR